MSRRLLTVVLRRAHTLAAGAGPGAVPDAALLARFAAGRDEAAFDELLRRHGPMVWAACRHLLADEADAEDAFQATFLALVRSAKAVKNGAAVGGWLHGVAVRVAGKLRREAGRRKAREQHAAGPEADRPVPDSRWDSLLAAVHEEVQRLPDALRAAFVLCDLEGVRQPDAAARLGWKPGTLTGRLCKARQELLDRLARRGIAPAAAAGAVGVGAAAGSAAVPAALVTKLTTLAGAAADAVPPAILKLVLEATPMTVLTRTKLVAAALLVAGGLSPALVATVGAQGPGEGGPPLRPRAEKGAKAGNPFRDFRAQPGGEGRPAEAEPGPPGGQPGGPPGPRGVPGSGGGGGFGGFAAVTPSWEYRIVGKPADPAKFMAILRENGDQGWEYVCTQEFAAADLEKAAKADPDHFANVDRPYVMVFKRAKGPRGGFGGRGGAFGGGGVGGEGGPGAFPGGPPGAGRVGGPIRPIGEGPGAGQPGLPQPGTGPAGPGPRGPGPLIPGTATATASRPPAAHPLTVIPLKYAKAEELGMVLTQALRGGPGDGVQLTADPRTNSLIIRASDPTLAEVKKLLEKLDVEGDEKPVPPKKR